MNKDILNYNKDENGNYHGEQTHSRSNGNIIYINNYHHGYKNGYSAWFNDDKSINIKSYWNMYKLIYKEDHIWYNNQIEIKI